MFAFLKNLLAPKVESFNPQHSIRVSNVLCSTLCQHLSDFPGVVFTKKPSLIQSCAEPLAEFAFRDVTFQIDHGGDTGGDGLWIIPKDEIAHPDELLALREHLTKSLSKN